MHRNAIFTILFAALVIHGIAHVAENRNGSMTEYAVYGILLSACMLAIAGIASSLSMKSAYRKAARALHHIIDGEEHERIPSRELGRAIVALSERLASPPAPLADSAPEPEQQEYMPNKSEYEDMVGRIVTQEDELRRNRALIDQLNSELISANRARADFIDRMGREIKVPLNTIIGLTDMLGRGTLGDLNDKQKEYAGRISERAYDIIGVVNDFTEFSHIHTGISPEYEDINIRDLCARVSESLETMAAAKGVELIIDVDDIVVRADHARLKFVLHDIMHNAVKFNKRGGEVRVFARVSGHTVGRDDEEGASENVDIVVSDTGIGIAQGDISKLFRPFSQLGDEHGLKPRGVGLSLYLVRKFVEMHGGKINVESRRGHGSTFTVTMPMHGLEAGRDAEIAPVKKILIVEDDPAQQELVRRCLAGEPFEIHSAMDGVEALKVVSDIKPDLILLDVMMPKLDGISVCKSLKRDDHYAELRHVPIVIMTSSDSHDMRIEGARAGADEFLRKPLDVRLMKERVRSLLMDKERYDNIMASYRTKEREASTDPLTGLYNRRTMQHMLERMLHESASIEIGLSVLMLDLDHFKEYNDTYGHPAGDELLKSAASIFRHEVRDVDVVARYGGEEFLIILPGTPPEMAGNVAERIRGSLKDRTDCTISIGVACYPLHADASSELVGCADKALYEAKENGRDRVVIYTDG